MSEDQNLEWKSTWRDEYLKWICGFANAQGGLLVIGKNDNGEIVGVKNPLRLLEDIPSKVQSQLGIVVDVNLKSEDEREYLEIRVDPHPNPISYKGEYHYRSGSTKQVLRGAALTRFLLGKHGRNWDDAPLPGVQLRDLDGRALDEFRRRAIASERLSAVAIGESDGDLIELLHLREGEHLQRAAVLLFHPDPGQFFAGAFVKIGYFRTATDLAYQDVVEGNLFNQVDRTVDLLRTKYSKAEVSYEGILRKETPQAPLDALREAVLNAIAHRDYSNPAPIQIRVYDDRISLWNPGALPPNWTLDKLMGTHASAPHNPGIANAFFRAGMIEAWGRGIENIVVTCRVAGTTAPVWEVEPDGLRLDFVFTQVVDEPSSDDSNRVHEGSAQPESRPELQPESRLELQPESRSELRSESLAAKVLQQLANGPMSKSELSLSLGQKRVSGQLNKVIRALMAEGHIGFTIPEKPRSRRQQLESKLGSQPESRPELQPELQPESRPESLAARVLQQLANGPKSKSELSLGLGQKRVSGQLNKVIRALMAEDHIGFTIPEKPRSQHQKYGLTDRGRGALDALTARSAGTGA